MRPQIIIILVRFFEGPLKDFLVNNKVFQAFAHQSNKKLTSMATDAGKFAANLMQQFLKPPGGKAGISQKSVEEGLRKLMGGKSHLSHVRKGKVPAQAAKSQPSNLRGGGGAFGGLGGFAGVAAMAGFVQNFIKPPTGGCRGGISQAEIEEGLRRMTGGKLDPSAFQAMLRSTEAGSKNIAHTDVLEGLKKAGLSVQNIEEGLRRAGISQADIEEGLRRLMGGKIDVSVFQNFLRSSAGNSFSGGPGGHWASAAHTGNWASASSHSSSGYSGASSSASSGFGSSASAGSGSSGSASAGSGGSYAGQFSPADVMAALQKAGISQKDLEEGFKKFMGSMDPSKFERLIKSGAFKPGMSPQNMQQNLRQAGISEQELMNGFKGMFGQKLDPTRFDFSKFGGGFQNSNFPKGPDQQNIGEGRPFKN
eukprot:Platyproteum_vivax@DN6910_c0_g1_i2.p1